MPKMSDVMNFISQVKQNLVVAFCVVAEVTALWVAAPQNSTCHPVQLFCHSSTLWQWWEHNMT
jgi:hypothetical protein